MKKISFAYLGSSFFSARLLEKIIKDRDLLTKLDLKTIITQPDRLSGRKQEKKPTEVKTTGIKYGYKVITDLELFPKKIDLALLYAYGNIINKETLTIPKYGFLNIHPSLLPLYRGTSPIATPLVKGDTQTGVTIIKMDDLIDHGPIADQKVYTIKNQDKRPDLETKLTDLGFELFKSLINKGIENTSYRTQIEKNASYTKKLEKENGFVKFENLETEISNSSEKLFNLFRGLYPWPGVWTILKNGKRLKITDMKIENGKLKIIKVQLEGKKEVDFKTFNKAYRVF